MRRCFRDPTRPQVPGSLGWRVQSHQATKDQQNRSLWRWGHTVVERHPSSRPAPSWFCQCPKGPCPEDQEAAQAWQPNSGGGPGAAEPGGGHPRALWVPCRPCCHTRGPRALVPAPPPPEAARDLPPQHARNLSPSGDLPDSDTPAGRFRVDMGKVRARAPPECEEGKSVHSPQRPGLPLPFSVTKHQPQTRSL